MLGIHPRGAVLRCKPITIGGGYQYHSTLPLDECKCFRSQVPVTNIDLISMVVVVRNARCAIRVEELWFVAVIVQQNTMCLAHGRLDTSLDLNYSLWVSPFFPFGIVSLTFFFPPCLYRSKQVAEMSRLWLSSRMQQDAWFR